MGSWACSKMLCDKISFQLTFLPLKRLGRGNTCQLRLLTTDQDNVDCWISFYFKILQNSFVRLFYGFSACVWIIFHDCWQTFGLQGIFRADLCAATIIFSLYFTLFFVCDSPFEIILKECYLAKSDEYESSASNKLFVSAR